jgi:hypothetical protein
MSGSITWREYTSDTGKVYAIAQDKSAASLLNAANGEAVSNVRTLLSAPLFPIGFKPRRIHCFQQSHPKVKRSFVFGNPKLLKGYSAELGSHYLYATSPNGEQYGDLWLITGYTGEQVTLPLYYSQVDTGLNDGTTY